MAPQVLHLKPGQKGTRYDRGPMASLDAAIEASREIVDEYLRSAHQPGMTTEALLTSYLFFGEDPYIGATAGAETDVLFSARDYARQRCEELCRAPA